MAAARLPATAAQGRRDHRPAAHEAAADAVVFHAGTARQTASTVTTGGRVLCVTALADTVKAAQQRAYEVLRGHPLRRRAVPARHRPPRDQGAMSMPRTDPDPGGRTMSVARTWLRGPAAAHHRRAARRSTATPFVPTPGASGRASAAGRRHDAPARGAARVFERAGCGFSHVRGRQLPPSATQHRPELAGAPFEAMGVSLVFHPRNPYAPTVHMNVRMLGRAARSAAPVVWFGGGMDLTPYYGFEEDARALPPHLPRRAGALRRRQVPALQELVRRVLLPEAPQRAARHRRHLLRRFRRAAASSAASP